MAKKQIVLCDTNILIDFYKGKENIISILKYIGEENIGISDIVLMEILYGARDKKDLSFLEKQLQSIPSFSINEIISKLAVKIIKDYSLSHNLTLADALIASTAIYHDFELFTLNTKDFKFINGLKLYKF